LEKLGMTDHFWRDKSVFVTGHTGFKGSWLSLALALRGAKVSGFALVPPTTPSMFDIARIETCLESHVIGDIRDAAALSEAVHRTQPEIIFHLAAQPLVRYSYSHPVETFETNVMGTVNLLEAVRLCPSVKSVVNVTTDKCYENQEWVWAYRENEKLGGHDPYSASKACAEIVTASYRSAFNQDSSVSIASARAGNVIGGGDWAMDRLIPDFFRASDGNEVLKVRSPQAIRPWQHVMEPVSGYMQLAEQLFQSPATAKAWNFGPQDSDARSVAWILDVLTGLVPNASWQKDGTEQVHEAMYLKLDSSMARQELGWSDKWNLRKALEATCDWHEAWRNGADMHRFTLDQILEHRNIAD
jgi:CDP-glucose 4,6-dehydratase